MIAGAVMNAGGGSLAGATATIETTSSVTMGNETLDSELRDKTLRVADRQAETILADDGTPRHDVHAAFRLRIDEPLGLTGPTVRHRRTTRSFSPLDSG